MTISQQPSQNSSASDSPGSFRIPSRPSTPAAGQNLPGWKMSEDEHQAEAEQHLPNWKIPADEHDAEAEQTLLAQPHSTEQSRSDVSTQATSALPVQPELFQGQRQSEPFASVPQAHQLPIQPLPAVAYEYQRNDASALPPPVPTRITRRRHGTLYLVLGVLAVVIVLGGLFGQQLLNNTSGSQALGPLNFPSSGPYAQPPLSASQINAIQHMSAHMGYKALASLYVSHMSLDDEIGQLIMVEYSSPDKYTASGYTSDLDYMLHTLHVGGVIMYESNMQTFDQTKNDIARMQQRANLPLLISTDEEGGPYVRRVTNIYGYRMSPTQIEASGDVNVATQQGLKVSQQLAALGINQNTTPDVDVNQVNGYDMVTRTFGNTPAQVIKYAGAYMQAMQGNGTIACIKHYPGLGGASPDAHKTLPVVNSNKQDIYNIDLAPFKAFIQSPNALLNPGMIMPTDVLLPAIDPKYPAELSHIFMTDILRKEFGYDGVVLTDALYMHGIIDTWDMNTAAVMALQAGDDMLLGATGTQQTIDMINAIKQALKDGRLTKARIDESVARIIALKMQYHLMPTSVPGM